MKKGFLKKLVPLVVVSLLVVCAVGCAKKNNDVNAPTGEDKNESQPSGEESTAENSTPEVTKEETKETTKETKTEETTVETTTQETKYFKEGYKAKGKNNPIVTQRYGADPGVMVYGDTVYIYTTNDAYEYKNGEVVENTYGQIRTINCFSSKDLVNWTDHGAIEVAGKGNPASWASCSWAPAAAHKTIDGKEKFFLYFANNGSGVGVLESDSPIGPWVDPVGGPLVTQRTENCAGVVWCFDPAVFVDDDGTGYLYFGGGIPKDGEANPKSIRVVKLGADMVSLDGVPVEIDAPYLFEDSCINKIDGKYIFSYCTNWNTKDTGHYTCAIEYMESDSPMGPFEHKGLLFKNPGIYWGVYGNNHHTLFEFNNQLYLAYHARALETAALGKNLGYRSTQLDYAYYEDGVLKEVKGSMKGVDQLFYVNPYEKMMAATMCDQAGIGIEGVGDTYVTDIEDGDWTKVAGVDFGEGSSKIALELKADAAGSVEVYVGKLEGEPVCVVDVDATNGEFVTFEKEVNLSGVNDIYFVFRGVFDYKSWQAAK